MNDRPTDSVIVGRISGSFGIRGWVRLISYTDPRENIIGYRPWLLRRGGNWQEIVIVDARLQGKTITARLEGIEDRDAAGDLAGIEIAVRRDLLPPAGGCSYYWVDLIGLRVVLQNGVELGRVERLIETGANDVLVVTGEKEHLVPFITGRVIRDVNLETGCIVIDWDPNY